MLIRKNVQYQWCYYYIPYYYITVSIKTKFFTAFVIHFYYIRAPKTASLVFFVRESFDDTNVYFIHGNRERNVRTCFFYIACFMVLVA